MNDTPADNTAWADAAWSAALLAVDPQGLGGIVLRAGAGPVRDRWSALLRALWPAGTPWRRMPMQIGDDRLLGGLDLATTLQAGRPVAQRGLLADSDGGVVSIAMAERLSKATAARLASALDRGEVGFERDGMAQRWSSRIAVVAYDEGRDDDPAVPAALCDRLAFHCDLTATGLADTEPSPLTAAQVQQARQRLSAVTVPDAIAQALCGTALRLGVRTMRATLLVFRAASAIAALNGRAVVTEEDARRVARLVLAPRATQVPPAEPASEEEAPAPEPAPPEPAAAETDPPQADEADAGAAAAAPPDPPLADDATPPPDPDPATVSPEDAARALEDRLIGATQAALPAGLLAALLSGEAARGAGRVGALSATPRGGRPQGVRAGYPVGGARLNLIETLRAAAPWQRLRSAAAANSADAAAVSVSGHSLASTSDAMSGSASAAAATAPPVAAHRALSSAAPARRIHVRASDLRVSRLQQRAATATLFVIDASGSAALHRLAEAKGAINLLLAECYVRRDQVGVIAFRGRTAEVLLPPTRSLVRAKRSLAALPGGGGTPLAAGLQAALGMAAQVRRAGAVPVLVLLTDGRANVALDGAAGRGRADADALQMARHLRAARLSALLVDTSPQPSPSAQRLAQAMAAPYRVLPYAGAAELAAAVRTLPRPAA